MKLYWEKRLKAIDTGRIIRIFNLSIALEIGYFGGSTPAISLLSWDWSDFESILSFEILRIWKFLFIIRFHNEFLD